MSAVREANAEPIPGYRLIEPIGSGGFGEVWKCEAPGGLLKAIKFVYGHFDSLEVEGVRAEQELKALNCIKEVRHPFICSLERIEVVDNELLIVMELAERTLQERFLECQNAGMIGIPRDDLLRYLRDAAEALDFMNEKHGLQHLDVKPRNLFLICDRVMVADFGLVKQLGGQSLTLGGVTPLYSAPETYAGQISPHSDQYSLAIVYQEMLTGQRPFVGRTVRQLAQQHLEAEPDLRALPEADRPVVARALSKDPTQRFPTCKSFIAALIKARKPLERISKAKALVGAGVGAAPETMEDLSMDGEEVQAQLQSPSPVVEPEEAQLGMTIPQPDTGALRPTLILGLGNLGRKALLELRCRFLDRFGDLEKLPIIRFLAIDTDPEAVTTSVRGAPEVALSRSEFCHLPLQPVGNYRRRSLDQVSDWLPREKLYAMPRSLQTQGSRALARLAFADNHQRLLARLRRDIQEITHPDKLYQAVSQTGLALRDSTPRVYVLAAGGGGSSGLLPDLGYALRRLLAQLRHPDAKVTVFLLCGFPGDPASPKAELANLYATLTELNHFSDPAIPFAAQYGADGQRLVDQESPYHCVYLLPMAHRSPEALESGLAHLGSYLFHEITTPLGLRLDREREVDHHPSVVPPPGATQVPLRSLGTYAVWFPRGLLMRLASRRACRRLLENWLASGAGSLTHEAAAKVQAFQEKVINLAELKPEVLSKRIEELAPAELLNELGNNPREALIGFLSKLEEQSMEAVAQEDPGNWARQALNRVREWIGQGEQEEQDLHDWRKTRLNRCLLGGAQKLAEEWEHKLSQELWALMDHPGTRLASAELALQHLHNLCKEATQQQSERIQQKMAQTVLNWKQVEQALQECLNGGGGFRWFGGRSKSRQLKRFMESLAQFARQRLEEELAMAVRHFWGALVGRLKDRDRDLGFCRQRLRHLVENLESRPADPEEEIAATRPGSDFTLSQTPLPSTESFWEAIRQSPTARVVLPEGEEDLERAAIRFLQKLLPEHWTSLDKELHERVLAPRGGLHGSCVNNADLTRTLALPLLEETGTLLSQHLPIMDVAQILCGEFGLDAKDAALTTTVGKENLGKNEATSKMDWTDQVKEYFDRATPLIPGKAERNHHSFLLVPASSAGKTLADAVHQAVPEVRGVPVPGQSDLMFCREQGILTSADLSGILKSSRTAYESLAVTPVTSPHARFDIVDWVPLD